MEVQEREGSKCQDCGNQAKKDCSYRRCRTCCKNKGFECQTHIQSTWVPVDRRQQRENQPSPTIHPHHFREEDIPTKHKHNDPYDSLGGLEDFNFPAATNSMAVFRCVKVRSLDDAVNDIAYHTSVKIGGRVFSGLLYDQGPDHQSFYASRGDTSTRPPNASSQTHDGASATMAPLLLASHDEPSFPPPYSFPSAPFRPGMPYFSQPRP